MTDTKGFYSDAFYTKEDVIYDTSFHDSFEEALDYAFWRLRTDPLCHEVFIYLKRSTKAVLTIDKHKIQLIDREQKVYAVNERKIKKFFKEGGEVKY